jgi:diguanylate cyclase (GGDEF)-like protein
MRGVSADALDRGLAFARLVEPGVGRSRYDAILDAPGADLGDGVPYRTRYVVLIGDRRMWVEDTGRWFAGCDGGPARARGVMRLERPVSADDLNPNRAQIGDRATLIQRLDELIADQMPASRSVVLLVAAIDDLGRLNEEFGQTATDEVLNAVQRRLVSVMRQRDRLLRYSSNLFAVLLTGCPTEEIERTAHRFIRVVSGSAIETQGGVMLARIRIGAAHAPDVTRDSGELVSAAETALQEARRGAVESIAIARHAERRSRARETRVDQDALAALNERRIRIARQPVVRASDRSLAFHEGLVRVEQASGGFYPPAELMPLLERRGLIRLFDHRVLELALNGLSRDRTASLSINVSPQSLADPVWADAFTSLARNDADAARRLIVEVTETATIAQPDESRRVLTLIKDCGCGIAIDDFGAGHTSLRHLREFPIDILKLDGAFTQNLERSTDDRFFVRTLVDLARHLQVETVAEWVDSEMAASLLHEWGVTYLQGHLTGKAELWTPGETGTQAAA